MMPTRELLSFACGMDMFKGTLRGDWQATAY